MEEVIVINKIIQKYKNKIYWNNIGIPHQLWAFQSIENLLKKSPLEMKNYLINYQRYDFQSKLFKEYVSIVEKSLPISFKYKKEYIVINSIIDVRINLFQGLNEFIGVVDENGIIKNNTSDYKMYSNPKKFYIGKVVNIMTLPDKTISMNNIIDYSFTKIHTKNISPFTKVLVSFLKINPHLQSGAMSHINRARKKIVDEALLELYGEENKK